MIKEIKVKWIKPNSWNELAKFQLLEEVRVNGYIIESGFITDGSSIPFGFRDSFNPLGKAFPAAIAHDHRCANKVPRYEANELFYRDLKDCGVNKFRAYAMYIGVETYRIVMRIK